MRDIDAHAFLFLGFLKIWCLHFAAPRVILVDPSDHVFLTPMYSRFDIFYILQLY